MPMATGMAPRSLPQASALDTVQLLEQLLARALVGPATPAPTATAQLSELALREALIARLSLDQMPTVHHALVAGARLDDVAEALGIRIGQCGELWLRWARRQRDWQLRSSAHTPRCLVTDEQIADVVARHPELWPGGAS